MVYDEVEDILLETDIFNYQSERIGTIAASWNMTLEECILNVQCRARYREIMVEYAKVHNKPQLLSAEWVARSNSTFWNLIERFRKGSKINYEGLLVEWNEWFEGSAHYA
jgi:hypothetical protein